MTTLREHWERKDHFTCPRCGAKSWNLNDIRERYCGRCHTFDDNVQALYERERARFRRHQEAQRRPPAPSDSDPPSPFTFTPYEPPAASSEAPTAPLDPPSTIDPGGGSSGGGGASGDF
jgi:ribosomal protein L37E